MTATMTMKEREALYKKYTGGEYVTERQLTFGGHTINHLCSDKMLSERAKTIGKRASAWLDFDTCAFFTYDTIIANMDVVDVWMRNDEEHKIALQSLEPSEEVIGISYDTSGEKDELFNCTIVLVKTRDKTMFKIKTAYPSRRKDWVRKKIVP